MKNVSLLFAPLGLSLGFFFGEIDKMLTALIVITIADYISGVMYAICNKQLSSEIGYKGIIKKVSIFILVALAHIIDNVFIGEGASFRTATILFYLANEGISILENFARLGVPLPKKLIDILAQIKKIGDGDSNDKNSKHKN